MFKKLISTFGGFAAKPDAVEARNDEEITLGASCEVSFPSKPELNKVLVERRTRPRVIQHTESLKQGPKIYRDNGVGYVNEKDENDKLTYEQARDMQAMPKPELEAKFGSELFVFKQARTQGIPARTDK
jgi:hypothetical protein